MKKQCFAAALTAGLSVSALAATTNVATVADLIGAVRDATSGTEIVVMASGSPYVFAADDVDVVGHLYARARITLRGETGDPADVVLVGNANRILYLAGTGNTISGLTFRNGDCTGYAKRDEEPYDQMRGGAICLRGYNDPTTEIRDCVFQSCRSNQGGGACANYSTAGTGGKYDNCVFDGNSTQTAGGGAVFRAASIRNCTFRNNCSNAANGGALSDVPEVVGCTIVSNATSSTWGFGGGAYNCTLTGCLVASNYAYRCGAAADSRLYSCTNRANRSQGDYLELGLTSGGPGCYAENCTFIDVGKSGRKTFGVCAFSRCRFDDRSFVSGSFIFSQSVAMTNCLIASVGSVRLFEGLTGASTLVNCSVVSNSYNFTGNSASYLPVLDVKNCFFCGNNGGADIPAVATNVVVSFTSSILAAASDDYVPGSENRNYYPDRMTFNPGFAGAAQDPENPYAITQKSPAFEMVGRIEDWMASATDIRGAGFPRLRGGKVNIGCYQCWDVLQGFRIIFR